MRPYFALLFAFACTHCCSAQDWLTRIEDPYANYFVVKAAYEQWRAEEAPQVAALPHGAPRKRTFRNLEKHFLRWAERARWRTDEHGDHIGYRAYWQALAAHAPTGDERGLSEHWSCIGPYMQATVQGLGVVSQVAVHPQNDSIVCVATEDAGCWRTTDQGGHWQRVPALYDPDLVVFDPVDGDHVYAISLDKLFRSDDAGLNWTELPVPDSIAQRMTSIVVDPGNPLRVDLYGYQMMARSEDQGSTWTWLSDRTVRSVVVKPDDPSIRYGLNGVVLYRSSDGGLSYDSLTSIWSDFSPTQLAVSPAAPDRVYALLPSTSQTGLGKVAISEDQGQTFTYGTGSTLLWAYSGLWSAFAVSPTDPDLILAGGIYLGRSTDGGQTWTSAHALNLGEANYMHVDHRHVLITANGAWSANDGGINYAPVPAETWEDRTADMVLSFITDIDRSPVDPAVFAFGAWHNCGTSSVNGQLSSIFLGDGFNVAIDAQDPDHVIVHNQYGDAMVTFNGGQTVFPGNAPDSYGFQADKPVAIDPNDGSKTYVLRGNVFGSTDGGLTYTQLSNFTQDAGGWTLLVHPANGQYIFTRYHRSTDGGQSWQPIDPPYRPVATLALDPADPDRFWVLSGAGITKVHRTEDGGETWQEVNTVDILEGASGLIAYVANGHNGLLLIKGASVFYLDDRFSNWQPAGDGLPFIGLTDVNVHPVTGEAMISTAGRGLWTSPLSFDLTAAPVADLIAEPTTLCPGQSVRFHDNSLNSGPGFGSTYQWSFPGGVPSTSTEASPLIEYPASGDYDVQLVLTTANGQDSIAYTALIHVELPMDVVPWAEGFEEALSLPDGWSLFDPDGPYTPGWVRYSGAAAGGYSLSASSFRYHEVSSTFGPTVLMTPAFDLSDPTGWMLLFDRAYQPPLAGADYDTLRVFHTPDCSSAGELIHTIGGADLGTTTPANGIWVPSASTWRTDTVFLTGLELSATTRFGFAGHGYGPNIKHLYIDNVRLVQDPSTGLAANKAFDLRLMPNPTDDELLVQLAQTPADDAFLDLFDPSGRILMRVPFRGVRHLRLATAALADGTYLLHVVNGAEILDRRFVKLAR